MGKKKTVKAKGKKAHVKSDSSQKYKAYKVEAGKLNRVKKSCVKCGAGVFMAEHKNRYTCGACGYTIFKNKKE
ncbi:30S ribosomal protein S27ae [Candidatus Tiddalikarchaeum anstoanum]|nr:30S ribosomal protein S27ae [Candidatus Tiddalikarchaeum anstoanum]